jgi:hypothetical protein
MHKRLPFPLPLALLSAVVLMGGCQVRQDFPEPATGWHAADFSVVFGRLQRVEAADPEEPPTWTVRFGGRQDGYGGQLALTPARMMAGFSNGEPAEIRGHIVGEAGGAGAGDATKAIHYEVESIRLWMGYRE